ncbi:MAG: enoyl-CoA hydratase/isomerase family protein [Bdellovibrionales bacterium]|nr:enoyl-CoA hydratase/isomerase family protein [Bdellovibrionales bacterium]
MHTEITSDSTSIPPSPSTQDHTSGRAQLERRDSGVAILWLGPSNEKTISLTRERMSSLREALEDLKNNPPRGLVITGPSKSMYTVGADIHAIREISDPVVAEELAKEGQDVFGMIESLPCITVAAISGPCVGGGCELSLACRYRIITDEPQSIIGLPETKLGILPGFGGSQRLPRLIGLPRALDIILSGKTLRPKQALKAGLVNKIVSYDQLIQFAEQVSLKRQKVRETKISFIDRLLTFTGIGRSLVQSKAGAKTLKQTKGHYPAPPAALQACIYGLEKGMKEGLAHEASELGRLLVTPESKALVRLFFLTEASKNIGKDARSQLDHLQAVVVGAGIMGAGIAGILAKNKSQVILKDTSEEGIERGVTHIKSSLAKIRYLSETDRSFILNRIEATTRDSSNLGNAHFAIEAIFEDLQLKKKVLGDLAQKLPEDAIIATNTSSLSVSKIAEAIARPDRVIGMHFFNPVEKMPLVEIVRGNATSDKSVAIVAALATKLGKFPIVVEDVPGFLVNRILTPYLNEAGFLLHDGYSIEDIDREASRFGMPMGPIRLLDEVGLDVASHVSDVMIAGYGDRMKGPGLVTALLEAGRKGKKSGGGFYDYDNDQEAPSGEAKKLLGLEKKREVGDKNLVVNRLMLSLMNEAVLCLDEGVAGAPGKEAADQIDLGTVMGMGFPPFYGGLLAYADSLGAKEILSRTQHLEKECGPRFTPVKGIVARAEQDKSFYEPIC